MTTPASVDVAASPWSPARRAATTGIVLLVTNIAFENMGVGTAMPRIAADLHGEALYSWPFTAFLAASVLATVLSGQLTDRRGPALSLLLGPGLFVLGLIVAGTAPGMAVLLAGRVLQGLGAGTQIVGVYVLIAVVYPERERPGVFGILSAAWVVPALVGPALSGLVTEHLGWRWVFLGLVPLVLAGFGLLAPAIRSLPPHAPTAGPARRGLRWAAVAAALGVTALTWAAQHPSWVTLPLGVAGLAVLVPAFRRLLPPGTLRAAAGLPATILGRGLLAGSYFAVEAYVPLTLTVVHGFSPVTAGLPLTIGALGWSAASMWQGRHPDVPRPTLIRIGFTMLAVALAGLAVIAPAGGPAWPVWPLWLLGGSAMGLSMSSLSVLTLSRSSEGDRGFNSAALQISDMTGSALLIGFGGVLVSALATPAHPGPAVLVLDLLMAGVAALGVWVAVRIAR